MEANKRIVNLAYVLGTIICVWVFAKAYGSIFGTFGIRDSHLLGRQFTTSNLLGVVTGLGILFYTWRHPTVRPVAHEVAEELSKVTWPTNEETKNNTKVTILVTVVISLILWLFDMVFGNLTNLLLGGGNT